MESKQPFVSLESVSHRVRNHKKTYHGKVAAQAKNLSVDTTTPLPAQCASQRSALRTPSGTPGRVPTPLSLIHI